MNTDQITSSIPPELLAELESTFSNFSAIAVVVFLAFVLWGAFQGWRRSIFRQVVHVAITAIIAVVAVTLISNVCAEVIGLFDASTIAKAVAEVEVSLAAQNIFIPEAIKTAILETDATTFGYAIAVLHNTILAPLMIAVLFGLIALVGKIVTSIVCFFVPKGRTLTFRLLGIAGGVIEGALIAGVVLLPLVAWVNIAGNAVDVVRESSAEDDASATEIVEFYDDVVAPLEKHVIFQTVGSLGGNAILDDLATVEIDGEARDLRDEFNIVVKLGYDISKLQNADFKNLTETDKETVGELIDGFGSSVIISRLSCGVVNGFANAISDGSIPIIIDEPYYSILMEAASILGSEKTNPSTLGENLTTFKNVYFLLSDEGVLTLFVTTEGGEETVNKNALTGLLTEKDENGNTVLNRVIDELDKNESTKDLIPLVGKLAVATLYDSLGMPEGAEDAYESVKEGIQEVLALDTTDMTPEEAKASVAETLTDTLEGIGITVGAEGDIEKEAVEAMADFVLEKQDEIKDKLGETGIDPENITDTDILNVLLSYYTDFLGSAE